MHFEFPEVRRGCLCLPLRKGILVFGYLNLILTILQIVVQYTVHEDGLDIMPLRQVIYHLPSVLTTVLCAIEIVFNILLIYGIHTKRVSYIKVYYYFMIGMLLESVILLILRRAMYDFGIIVYLDFICCFVVNMYLLFMVRSLIIKLRVSTPQKFRNQLSDFVEGRPDDRVYDTDTVVPKDSETV